MQLQDYIAENQKPPTMDDLVRRIHEISTLPQVAMKTIEVANDPKSSAIDMKEIIESDAALGARILRCVNSSAYATREKVTSLQQAISYLGLRQIRNLALTASVAELFAKEENIGSYRRRGLWGHLVAVGICSRLIAMRQKISDFEAAFAAGLLHDIGIVLEDQYVHGPFCTMVQSLRDGTTLVEAERTHLGFDHARLGAKVAELWRFPENVKAAIGYHHMSVNYRGNDIEIVRCVEVANLICTVKGYPSVGLKLVKASQPALNALSLTKEHIVVLAHDLDEELTKHAALFEL
jgi:putative nucleotidyltransferase with HDIG domain